MKQKTVFYSFMALLIVVGLSLLWLRYEQLGIPLMPETQVRVWLVEARIEFSATGDETLVNLSLPENPPGFRLLSEQAASPGYGFARISSADRRRGMVKTGSARHPEPLLQRLSSRPPRNGIRASLPPESRRNPGRFSGRNPKPQQPRTCCPPHFEAPARRPA